MEKPKLLDLFCGAGGCARGYADAGFEVVGVDIAPQPHYPYEFHQADALTFPLDGFDVIHASPPCQGYSRSLGWGKVWGEKQYPLLIGTIRERLEGSGKVWVIENVEGSPLPDALELCGSMFNLPIRRHRWFSSSIFLFAPGPCRHTPGFYNAVGGKVRGYGTFASSTLYREKRGTIRRREGYYRLSVGHIAMDIDWMSMVELSQAVPPPFTYWIGLQLMDYLKMESAGVA